MFRVVRVVRGLKQSGNGVTDDSLEYRWPDCRTAAHTSVAVAVVAWAGPRTVTDRHFGGYERTAGHSGTAAHMNSLWPDRGRSSWRHGSLGRLRVCD